VDDDGLDDMLIGAYGDDAGGTNAGAAYIVLGKSLGTTSSFSFTNVDYKLVGENSKDYTYLVASAGAVDGDGRDDIIIGADGNDDGGSGAGKAYLFFGGL
jgi:hypothetical protein